MNKFLEALLALLGFKKTPAPKSAPTRPADSADEPAKICNSRVLVIVYDPIMDAAGRKLSQVMNWKTVEELATGFMSDIIQSSGGMARYQIVQRIDVNEFPAKTDGFCYDSQTFMAVLRGETPPHMPQEVDYNAILNRFHLLERVAKNEIDEVWVFGFPHAGFYESIMVGPGAFWCNGPQVKNTDASLRRFVIMGFSYERGVGEMLESFGHRVESIMLKTFEKLSGEANLWVRFTRYDKLIPGKSAIGTIHYAPNSTRDYEWDSPVMVKSECYDWLNNFPNFKGDIKEVNKDTWGGGDIRAHHQWWLNHLPRVAGRQNGVHNNWWQYIIDPNNVF